MEAPARTPLVPRSLAVLGLGAWVLVGLWYALPHSPSGIERWYSQGLFRGVASLLVPLTSALPFSLLLWGGLGGAAGALAWWGRAWRRLRKEGRPWHHALAWGLGRGLALLGLGVLWALVAWGGGYGRLPLATRLAWDLSHPAPQEAAELRAALLAVVHRDGRPEGRDGGRALAAISRSMARTVATWEGRAPALPLGIKRTPPGLLLLNGTTGFCSPLTLEPHVDGALPEAAQVWTGAHELAHITGHCSEDEASALGWVAGLNAEDPFARYACALMAYLELARQLPSAQYREAYLVLPPWALEDLRAESEALKRHRIQWYQRVSWKVYHAYLQTQGVQEGVKSYSRGITLFLGAWRSGSVTLRPSASTHP